MLYLHNLYYQNWDGNISVILFIKKYTNGSVILNMATSVSLAIFMTRFDQINLFVMHFFSNLMLIIHSRLYKLFNKLSIGFSAMRFTVVSKCRSSFAGRYVEREIVIPIVLKSRACNSLVRHHLECTSTVWNQQKIETIQLRVNIYLFRQ